MAISFSSIVSSSSFFKRVFSVSSSLSRLASDTLMERGKGDLSAVQEVERDYGIPVIAVASLQDLMAFLEGRPDLAAFRPAIGAYRDRYGVAAR